MTTFLEVEFCVQSDAARLVPVYSCDDRAVPKAPGAVDQLLKEQRPDALPMVLVMDIDRILDRVPVGAPWMIGGERTPADHPTIQDCDDHGMSLPMMPKPFMPTLQR